MSLARSESAYATSGIDQAIIHALGMDVGVHASSAGHTQLTSFSATARMRTPHETIYGSGTGPTPEIAQRCAVMECAERFAQFGCFEPPIAVIGSYVSLMPDAISPLDCGLYSDAQYNMPDFGLAQFSESEPLEWLEVYNILTGARRLLPVEFIYPRVRLKRKLLVAESSSGTAAHIEREAATLAAVCEVVERDSVMQFWYRQPSTSVLPVETIPDREVRNALHNVQAMGYVVTVCRLVYDLQIPCYLILALKGETFAYGLGCHPNWREALEHAFAELSSGILWLREVSVRRIVYQSLCDLHMPADHYALYNQGPLHYVLRQVLSHVLHTANAEGCLLMRELDAVSPHMLSEVLKVLAARGYHAYACDITPPILATCGIAVMRVLVPGLIPIHFGHNRLRMGCSRLWQGSEAGRFATWLPHFIT